MPGGESDTSRSVSCAYTFVGLSFDLVKDEPAFVGRTLMIRFGRPAAIALDGADDPEAGLKLARRALSRLPSRTSALDWRADERGQTGTVRPGRAKREESEREPSTCGVRSFTLQSID